MPSALITGGCGFVGRHFAVELLRRGYEVTVVDDLSAGLPPEEWPEHLRPPREPRFLRADVRDYFRAEGRSFDLIVHLAAVVGGRVTIETDPLKVATDLAIDATFFNWLPRLRPRPGKVLYFSSSAAYPICLQRQVDHRALVESDIDFRETIGVPDMTYGWSKLSGEYLAKHSVEEYGLDVVIYRPFSGYGEDQDLTYPFPSIVKRVVDREVPVTIWGSGRQTRDFIHIDDCVEAVLVTMDLLAPGEAINLASGRGTSFFELAELCLKVSGHQAPIQNAPGRPEGVFYRVGDTEWLSRYFKPTIDLEEGVRRQVEFLSRRASAAGLATELGRRPPPPRSTFRPSDTSGRDAFSRIL